MDGGEPMTTYDADAFNALEATGWDRRAQDYERVWAGVTARVADRLLDAAGVQPGTRVLDVGTGPGELAARAAARGAVALGIDPAAGMLALAARKHPGVEFRAGNAEQLLCADASFDAVLASFVLLHVGRQERALAEFARVLVPGGRVALTLWSPESAVHAVFLESMSEMRIQPPPEVPPGPPIVRPDDEVIDLVRGAGFADVRLEHVLFSERFASPEAMRLAMLDAAVRLPPILEAQPAEVRSRLDADIDARLAAFAVDGGIDVPVAVQLVSGVKPSS